MELLTDRFGTSLVVGMGMGEHMGMHALTAYAVYDSVGRAPDTGVDEEPFCHITVNAVAGHQRQLVYIFRNLLHLLLLLIVFWSANGQGIYAGTVVWVPFAPDTYTMGYLFTAER
jgi:hypothetical protein